MDKTGDKKPCGAFRRCQFPCGHPPVWIVATCRQHQEGETVLVGRRDGTTTEVVLGEGLTVLLGDKIVENYYCFRIAKPKLRAVDTRATAEVAELERLHRL